MFGSSDPRADQFTDAKHEIGGYIGNEYTNGGDIRWMLERENNKMIEPLEILATGATEIDRDIFKVNVSEYVNLRNRLRANLESEFTLILGQCNKLTRMQL